MGHDETMAADAAMTAAFGAAERVAALLDRHYGDAGDDAELIGGWADRLRQLEDDITLVLGHPREKLPSGAFAPRPYASLMEGAGHE